MEKKTYITPAAKEVNLLTMEMLATSSVAISNRTTDQDATMSNERRDGWGDLWN